MLNLAFKTVLRAGKLYGSVTRFPTTERQLLFVRRTLGRCCKALNHVGASLSYFPGVSEKPVTLKRCDAVEMVVDLQKPTSRPLDRLQKVFDTLQPSPVAFSQSPVTLFLHGGGFMMCNPESYKVITSTLARLTGGMVFVPNYRKAPETLWPANINDCVDAYRHLVDRQDIDAGRIVFAGHSAGGNLAVATFIKAVQSHGLPPPSGMALMSPWLDLTCSGDSYTVSRKREALIPHAAVHRAAWLYLKGTFSYGSLDEGPQERLKRMCEDKGMPYVYGDEQEKFLRRLKGPLVSPVELADEKIINLFPSTLIHCGADELLLSDAHKLAAAVNKNAASEHGDRVTVKVIPNAHHALPFTWPFSHVARESIAELAHFICAKTTK